MLLLLGYLALTNLQMTFVISGDPELRSMGAATHTDYERRYNAILKAIVTRWDAMLPQRRLFQDIIFRNVNSDAGLSDGTLAGGDAVDAVFLAEWNRLSFEDEPLPDINNVSDNYPLEPRTARHATSGASSRAGQIVARATNPVPRSSQTGPEGSHPVPRVPRMVSNVHHVPLGVRGGVGDSGAYATTEPAQVAAVDNWGYDSEQDTWGSSTRRGLDETGENTRGSSDMIVTDS